MTLTQTERQAAWQRDGFVIVRNVFSPEEVQAASVEAGPSSTGPCGLD